MNQFSTLLSSTLEEMGLSQTQAAKIIGIQPRTLSNYANGTREPDLDTLKKILTAFNMTERFVRDFLVHNVPRGDKKEGTDVGPQDAFQRKVIVSLKNLSNDIARTRAEVRAATEYQVMKDAKNNEVTRQALMEQINNLIGANLRVDEGTGTVIYGGN